MTNQELLQAIHFRTIDTPCCGNCKWLVYNTLCHNKRNRLPRQYPLAVEANNVCDRFERKEEKHD